jgi:kinesin family protein 6/9
MSGVTEKLSFTFDKVLNNVNQETVYEECGRDFVYSLFEGYNGTVMCYGQTGAGKTYTMCGATEVYAQRGIIPRAIEQIFRCVPSLVHSPFY